MTTVGWKARSWGTPDSDVFILGLPGIEDRINNAANITGGRDGGAAAPSFADIKAFVADIVVFADSDADMDEKLRDIYAVTWGSTDPTAEDPFTFTIPGQEELTVFSRFTNRQNPTSFETRDRFRACRLQIAYEATDPMVYAALETAALNTGGSLTIDKGWAPSNRWTWTAAGPSTNARLEIATPGYPDKVVHLSGSIPSGKTLTVESRPDLLVTEIDGDPVYSRFDNGDPDFPAEFPKLLPGQTVTHLGTGTAGTFSYWPARP
jgi:hypothetical protein